MKTPPTENRRNQKAYLYGTVLWFICKEPIPTKRIKALAYSMNVGNNLHDYFVAAGVIEKVAFGMYKAVSQVGPSLEICLNCYDAQTKRVNESKAKSKPSPELFPSVQELTVESLAKQVSKLTQIMNKLVNQTPTQNP